MNKRSNVVLFLSFILITSLQLISCRFQNNSEEVWKKFSPIGHNFSVMMPAYPNFTDSSWRVERGIEVPAYLYSYKPIDSLHVNDLYVMGIFYYPDTIAYDVEELLSDNINLTVDAVSGELVSSINNLVDGFPGKAFKVTIADVGFEMYFQTIFFEQKIIQIYVITKPANSYNKSIYKFIDSFNPEG